MSARIIRGSNGDLPVQLELFERSLPDRPYCTDDFAYGLKVLPRSMAKQRRYIQPQPPWLRLWLVFDYDHDCAWCAADEAGLPAPTITVVNRQNGHGHLLYGIDTPVRMENWGGRRAPARYLADVERAMTAQLGADPSYSGFTCKNPLHRRWVTLYHDHPYSLGELRGWLGDRDEAPPARARHRPGPQRGDVRLAAAMGLSERAGAQGGGWHAGDMAGGVHQRGDPVHPGAPPPAPTSL